MALMTDDATPLGVQVCLFVVSVVLARVLAFRLLGARRGGRGCIVRIVGWHVLLAGTSSTAVEACGTEVMSKRSLMRVLIAAGRDGVGSWLRG